MVKMTYTIRVFIFLLLMGCATGAMAEDLRIGVVNAAKVLEEAPQAEAARSKLEREFAPRDRELVGMQRELQSLEEKMSRDAAVMSDEQRRQLERDILAGKRDVKRAQEEFRDDLNIRRNDEFGKLQREIVAAIAALAEEEGYDLILGEGVIYAGPKVDLSQKVVQRLKKAFKPAASAPAK